jgi:hypothetical protein
MANTSLGSAKYDDWMIMHDVLKKLEAISNQYLDIHLD